MSGRSLRGRAAGRLVTALAVLLTTGPGCKPAASQGEAEPALATSSPEPSPPAAAPTPAAARPADPAPAARPAAPAAASEPAEPAEPAPTAPAEPEKPAPADRPKGKIDPRKACKRDADCVLVTRPCTCEPCGDVWRETLNRKANEELEAKWARRKCVQPSCPDCTGRYLGTSAVCVSGQCAVR